MDRETEALKIIWQKGGKTSIGAVARLMRVNPEYGKIIVLDLGKKDYIDVDKYGICKITEKGKEILKSRGILAQLAKEEEARRLEEKKISQSKEERSKIITLKY